MSLGLQEEDALLMLEAGVQIGSKNVNFQMKQYVYAKNRAGFNIFRLDKIWDKLQLAARAICAVENSEDVCAVAQRTHSQRAVLKFSRYTKATPIAGRFTPGTFTNQIQAAFKEPRLLVINDPMTDHQPIREASFVNIPVVAFCNCDSPLRYVDIVIPCNNLGDHSIGLMWWLLAREVLRMRGHIGREYKWDVMVDLFFYRSPDEQAEEAAAAGQVAPAITQSLPGPVGGEPMGAPPVEIFNQGMGEGLEEASWDTAGEQMTGAPAGLVQVPVGGPAPGTVMYGAVGQGLSAAPAAISDWGAVTDNDQWS